jgi:hypothetical protein
MFAVSSHLCAAEFCHLFLSPYHYLCARPQHPTVYWTLHCTSLRHPQTSFATKLDTFILICAPVSSWEMAPAASYLPVSVAWESTSLLFATPQLVTASYRFHFLIVSNLDFFSPLLPHCHRLNPISHHPFPGVVQSPANFLQLLYHQSCSFQLIMHMIELLNI